MQCLEITVDKGGQPRTLRFDAGPVRMGRAPSNQLVLDEPWISTNHGVFSVEHGVATYCDLRSRNGSLIEGNGGTRQAVPNQVTPLEQGDRLVFGALKLTVRVVPVSGSISASGLAAPANPGTAIMSAQEAQKILGLAQKVGGVGQSSPSAPAATPPPSSGGSARIPSITPGHAPTEAALASTPDALAAIALAFAKGFLALRRSHEEFAQEVGIRPVTRRSDLESARAAEELLAQLLSDPSRLPARVAELEHLFDDLILHEVALLSGIREGVKALIDTLDPEGPFKEADSGRSLKLFDNRFDKYVAYFREQTEDDGDSVLFGSKFASAYASASCNGRREKP